MDLLIVGGTGVLSSAVAEEAIKSGINVTIINRGTRKNRIPSGATLIVSDKNNHSKIADAIGSYHFDAVIDFLCFNSVEIEDSFRFYKDYTHQYFFISSSAVYDSRVDGFKDEDSTKVNPIWNYSVDKWASEEHLAVLARKFGINFTIIRPCVTYDNTRIPYGIMPGYGYHWTLIERIKHGKPIITWNNGTNRCNMMRVEDFAVGVVGLIGNPKAYNKAFNVCGDECPSYIEVLNIISEWLGKEITKIDLPSTFYAKEASNFTGELLAGRALDSINSNKRIKDAVPQFKQTIQLKEGITKTLQAYKENGFQKGISWEFDAQCDRIIKKWCKENQQDASCYNLTFIDYHNNAKKSDRLNYWIEFNRELLFVRTIILLRRILRKLKK